MALRQLGELGYQSNVSKLKASDYGVPQRRVRIFIVCVRDNMFSIPSKAVANMVPDKLEALKCPKLPPIVARFQVPSSFHIHRSQWSARIPGYLNLFIFFQLDSG